MKKLVVAMLVAAMAVPALALTVTPIDNQDGTVSLAIDTDGVEVRGIALKVTASNGAKLVGIADADWTVKTEFNTFIDYLTTVDIPTTVVGETPAQEGHPFAVWPGVPGGGVAAVNAELFSISMGVLDPDGFQDGYISPVGGEVILTFKTGAGDVCFELDTTRGGIVGSVGDVFTVDFVNGGCVAVTEAGTVTCRDQFDASKQAYYDRYVAAGADPSVWCRQYQCRGDADGSEEGFFTKVRVGTQDLNIFVASWNKTPENGADPRADFDQAEEGFFTKVAVGTQDLNILVANWQKQDSQLADCPMYLP